MCNRFPLPIRTENRSPKEIYRESLRGRVFFYNLQRHLPKMNRNMKTVYEKFKGENNFLILSHTVDPETDSVGRMKQYADSLVPTAINGSF
jgi:protein SCO1/2